jgi:hypothetical protein
VPPYRRGDTLSNKRGNLRNLSQTAFGQPHPDAELSPRSRLNYDAARLTNAICIPLMFTSLFHNRRKDDGEAQH